jgi:hypothetical protein
MCVRCAHVALSEKLVFVFGRAQYSSSSAPIAVGMCCATPETIPIQPVLRTAAEVIACSLYKSKSCVALLCHHRTC